jgi:hypothetical protein
MNAMKNILEAAITQAVKNRKKPTLKWKQLSWYY